MGSQLQALELWRHSLVESVRSDAPDLSARQMALLLSVYMVPGAHTVRGLAKTLGISKPAVSRALDRLGELDYIRRERDDLDRRNVLVRRTPEGSRYLLTFGSVIVESQGKVAELSETAQPDFIMESALAAISNVTADFEADKPAIHTPAAATIAA